MDELERIETEMDEARVPREVCIGTESTADRVTWLIRRLRLVERRDKERFEKFSVEIGCLAAVKDQWRTADEIHAALGYGERDDVKRALEYLHARGLVESVNDGPRGNLYANKDVWVSEPVVFQAERAYQAGEQRRRLRHTADATEGVNDSKGC